MQWIFIGYSLAFGPDIGGVIGGLQFMGLHGVGLDPGAGTYPPILFAAFQLTFAAVTLAVITSACAERVKLTSFIVLALLWTTLVYDPVAHWAWGGGWAQIARLDRLRRRHGRRDQLRVQRPRTGVRHRETGRVR